MPDKPVIWVSSKSSVKVVFAAGVRRIEAVAGEAALAHIHQLGEQLDEAAASKSRCIISGEQKSARCKAQSSVGT